MSQPADRNLLFGVLALQMDFIKREQLIAAMQAWVFDKKKPLGQILVAQKALAEDSHALLEALVRKHLEQHGNDAEKSLAAVSSATSIKKDLQGIADPDVQASLMHVSPARARPADPYATVAPAAGMAASTGMRFRILRPHARGGLGEVYVAHDEELHREVALKEIQDRQADNLESRSRFLIEAEITGGLEHPGIVPVYGLGTYADGRPYYAMRFIRGDSLKDAIERFHKADAAGIDPGQRTLEMRGLLGRFVDVCNAIAYAHSRGVLHRDLKPGNIMLGKYGETLVVDWGLAKPMAEPLPGQASERIEPGEGSLIPHSISSSSQTLAGAALGTPQYMSPEQAAGRLDQLGPASDVYSLGATLFCLLTGQSSIDDKDVGVVLQKVQRGEIPKPHEIKKGVPPALEAVCLKAMALRPGDRYASPRGLADDIEHWLADEPVSAWPEPWTVKARRWMGRHRTLVTGVAAAALVALVGLILATVLLTAANERERQAKVKAEQNFALARGAVDRYFTQVSENELLHEPGMQPLRKKLLLSAREFYEEFVKERANDPTLQGELGKATFRLAQITGDIDSELDAIKLHEQAAKRFEALPAAQAKVDFQADLAACYHHLGRLHRLIDKTTQSEEYYKKSLGLWEQLVKDHLKESRFRAGLARTQLGLGNVYQFTGRLEVAQPWYQKSLDSWEALSQAEPKTAEYQRDLAVTQNNLGMIFKRIKGKEAEEKKAFAIAQTVQKKLVAEAPNISQYQNDLARTSYNLGEFKEAASLWQALVDRHPAVTDPHKTLAEAYSALSLLSRQQDLKKAEDAGEQASNIQRKLADRHPGIPSYQGDLGRGLCLLGEVHQSASQLDKAETAYKEGTQILEKRVRDADQIPHYQRDLARGYTSFGSLHALNKKPDLALDLYKKAISLWENLIKDHSGELDYSMGLRNSLWKRAETLTQRKSYAEAQKDWEQALERTRDADKPSLRLARAVALARSGNYQEAAKAADPLSATRNGAALYRLAIVHSLSSAAAVGDAKASEEYGAQAVNLLTSAREVGFFKTPTNLQKLQADPDLQALAARPDFKKLLSDLKAK